MLECNLNDDPTSLTNLMFKVRCTSNPSFIKHIIFNGEWKGYYKGGYELDTTDMLATNEITPLAVKCSELEILEINYTGFTSLDDILEKDYIKMITGILRGCKRLKEIVCTVGDDFFHNN